MPFFKNIGKAIDTVLFPLDESPQMALVATRYENPSDDEKVEQRKEEINNLKEKLEDANERNAETSRRIEQIEIDRKLQYERVELRNKEIINMRERLENANERSAETSRRIERMESNHKQLQREQNEKISVLAKKTKDLKASNRQLKEEHEKWQKDKNEMEKTCKQNEEKMNTMLKDIEFQRNELKLSQEEVKNLPTVIENARQKIGLDSDNFYNFGFAGFTKTGKSSLINSILGKTPKDAGAAKVGITEVTQEVTPYQSSKESSYILWDMPGSATVNHSSVHYFYDNALCAFDCLIFVLYDTITIEIIKFAIDAIRHKIPIVFVKSQMDKICQSLIDDGDIDENEKPEKQAERAVNIYRQQMYETLKTHAESPKLEIRAELRAALLQVKTYFVSARSMLKHVKSMGGNNETVASKWAFEEEVFMRRIFQLAGCNAKKIGKSMK